MLPCRTCCTAIDHFWMKLGRADPQQVVCDEINTRVSKRSSSEICVLCRETMWLHIKEEPRIQYATRVIFYGPCALNLYQSNYRTYVVVFYLQGVVVGWLVVWSADPIKWHPHFVIMCDRLLRRVCHATCTVGDDYLKTYSRLLQYDVTMSKWGCHLIGS